MFQNEVIPIPVQPTDTRTYIPTVHEMEEAVLAAESKGIRARMLLVTNPGNPLGTLYPEATLKVINEIGHFLNLVLMDEASNNYKKRGGGGTSVYSMLIAGVFV